jgi:uncharacterized membrane protein (UPF0182 family)
LEENIVESSSKNKLRVVALAIIGVILLLIGLSVGLSNFITDYLWFKDLGQTDVFWKKLVTMLEIGVPTFVVLLALSVLYLKGLLKGYRKRVIVEEEHASKKRLSLVAWLLGIASSAIIAGLAMTRLWFDFLQFTNSTSFNLKDPLFNLDVSFYIFRLEFLRQFNTLLLYAILAFVIITVIYYLFLISTLRPAQIDDEPTEAEAPKKTPFESAGAGNGMGGVGDILRSFLGGAFARPPGSAPATPNINMDSSTKTLKELLRIARKQISVLGVVFFIMVAINYFLMQFELLYSQSGVVYGAGFADINITLWSYRIMVVLSVISAVLFVFGFKKRKVKTVVVVPLIMVCVAILSMGASMLVQNLIVSPDEINKESKYLERNIEFTKEAYDLDSVTVKDFPGSNTLTSEDITANMDTIRNIRINDYDPTKTFYNSTQTIRQYYAFNDVDVDRYIINGEYTQTFVSAREIDETKIPQQWLNIHLKYTHGYGITLSRVDKVTASGQPDIMIKDIPPESEVEEIEITRPEIYFGELQNEYIITNTSEEEFNYPEGEQNVYNTYDGENGIKLNLIKKAMFAIKEQSMKLLVSSNIKSDSKIHINRNISQRVAEIMPYLDYSDPYLITNEGQLYWIIDAYTTSRNYPYSEPFALDQGNGTNYIRNSVKVVINAYSGDTDFYIVDDTDPMATTMDKIYPKLFKDVKDMPEGIRQHIRYPSTMLNIQANIYKKYHVNDIKVFYQGEDRWDIANEKVGASEKEVPMEPQYYIMKLPGEEDVEFINSIPYTPMNKVNMMGLLIARNDGAHYGEMMLLQLPKGKIIMGPSQIDAQIAQDTEISKDFSLWENSGSTYRRGNMFVIPIEDSIMYVEPIYLQASDNSLPEVKRIVLYYDDKIAYEETLAEALDSMFGDGTGDPLLEGELTGDEGDSDSQPGDTDPDSSGKGNEGDDQQKSTDELIDLVVQSYNNAIAAQKSGDWKKYGEELDKMEKYLQQLSPETNIG